MIVQDQREVIDFLSRASAYGSHVTSVERIDTHGAIVFLAGERAYKMKRAVRFPYMDYSTLDRRRLMCEAELRINRRTAPMIYERVAAVTRQGEALHIDGDGDPVEWLVVMRRFDQAGLFDQMAASGRLTADLVHDLAMIVAAFHEGAERRPEHGGEANIAWVIEGNTTNLRAAGPDVFDSGAIQDFDQRCRAQLARLGPLLEARRQAGFVRHCHGDLHLRNISLFEGRPVLFDAIEFNDKVACIDMLYDFAFLLMDFERRSMRALANLAFNTYLDVVGDYSGLAALPLLLACRAGISAHTVAAAARTQPDQARQKQLVSQAREYLSLARSFLGPAPGRIIAIGGFSGTGKSTIARRLAPELAPPPGAVVLRTDVIRKRLAGVAPTVRLDPSAYTKESSRLVYRTLIEAARVVAAAGYAVLVDGVFASTDERKSIAAAAEAAGVPFTGLWLTAPANILMARIERRRDDASDATIEVLRQQLAYDLGAIDWVEIDVSGSLGAILASVKRTL